MIYQYFDACSLLAILLKEAHSERAVTQFKSAQRRLATRLVYAEVVSTLNRIDKLRDNPLLSEVLKRWEEMWGTFLVLPIDDAFDHLHLAKPARLRTADALHLAACLSLQKDGVNVTLLSRDRELLTACEHMGLSAQAC